MRAYKGPENALQVSRFLAWCGNFLNQGGADFACLIQSSPLSEGTRFPFLKEFLFYQLSNDHGISGCVAKMTAVC
jgi:hypothetical protein